jgi:putative peptide zinc metalloprotease protein
MQQLEALWKEIAAFGANIATVPLDEIQERLTAYETEILDIIESDDTSRKPSAPAEATPPDEEAEPSEGASPATVEEQASRDGGDSAETDPDGVEPDPGVVEEPADEGAPETDPATPEPTPSPEAEPSSNP